MAGRGEGHHLEHQGGGGRGRGRPHSRKGDDNATHAHIHIFAATNDMLLRGHCEAEAVIHIQGLHKWTECLGAH